MAVEKIDDALIEPGKIVLRAADDAGMSPCGAAWMYTYDIQDWRYYLVTPLVDKPGRFATYKLMLKVLGKLSLPENLTIMDIHLASPNELFFKALSKDMPFDFVKLGTDVKLHGSRITGIPVEAVIYRMLPMSGDERKIEMTFRSRVRELAG